MTYSTSTPLTYMASPVSYTSAPVSYTAAMPGVSAPVYYYTPQQAATTVTSSATNLQSVPSMLAYPIQFPVTVPAPVVVEAVDPTESAVVPEVEPEAATLAEEAVVPADASPTNAQEGDEKSPKKLSSKKK